MFRLLILIALVAAVVWYWRRAKRQAPPAPSTPRSLPMVRCAHCGLHIPQPEALHEQDRWYCSQAHLEQDRDGRAG